MSKGPVTEPRIVTYSGNEISYPNCLVLDAFQKASDRSTILATVEHYDENKDGGFPWKIKPITKNALLFSEALEFAKNYAREHGVPIVLVNRDGFSADEDRRQSDTTIIPIPKFSKQRT